MKYKIFVFIKEKRTLLHREDTEEGFTVVPLAVIDAEEVFRAPFENLFSSLDEAYSWIVLNKAVTEDYRLTILPFLVP
jgi:hypothetical protein